MSKNVIVNGKTHNGVSFLEVLTTEGVAALFKDVDEAAGSLTGLSEVASGVFTVDAVKAGDKNPGAAGYIGIEHGMSGTPDGFAVVPMYFYDTIDENFFGEIYNNGWNIAGGRRSISSNTSHPAIDNGFGPLADETKIYPRGSGYGKFNPTYTDDGGNVGTQKYIWIAWKKAE